jgi:hypothetical protein
MFFPNKETQSFRRKEYEKKIQLGSRMRRTRSGGSTGPGVRGPRLPYLFGSKQKIYSKEIDSQ